MRLIKPKRLNAAELGGADPRSARDAAVPLPAQWGQYLARREQADEGVGRGPGGPPHRAYATSASQAASSVPPLYRLCGGFHARGAAAIRMLALPPVPAVTGTRNRWEVPS
jgi:hypothetical protein